jgi:hypothetical protein
MIDISDICNARPQRKLVCIATTEHKQYRIYQCLPDDHFAKNGAEVGNMFLLRVWTAGSARSEVWNALLTCVYWS